MSLVVLLIFIGFLGPTCVNLNNEFQSASSTVSPHNTSLSDKAVSVKTQMINRGVQLWPAANRTEIKTFRKGPLIIARRYWYPSLEIGLKKPQPTSRAFTTATTPTVQNTTQSFTSNLPPSTLQTITETATSEPPASNTTKSTISTQPNLIIQTSTTNEKSTIRSISAAPPTNTDASTTKTQQETINPTQPNITTHSILSTDYLIQHTTTTPLVTSMSSTRTPLTTTLREPINNTTKHTTTRNKLPTASQVTAESVGMDTSVQKTTTAVSSTNLPTTSGAGDGFQEFKTTTTPADTVKRTTLKVATETVMKTGTTAIKTTPISSPTTEIRTTTTELAQHATVSEGITLVPETTEVTIESSQAKTESATQVKPETVAHTLGSATTIIGVTQKPATKINSESATVNVKRMTTEEAKLATLHNDLESPEVTTESSMAKSTTIISKTVTIDHTLEGPSTVIRVTQESTKQADPGTASTAHSTLKSNTAQSSNAPTIAPESGTRTSTKVINKPEEISSKITSTQGSSSVINSESATVDIRTITTATLPEDFTTVQETSKPVTIAPTLEGPTTVNRVTQLDADTASTTHTTLKSNIAQSSNLTSRETESGTSKSTAITNKTTPAEYTNSVLKSTKEGTRTTTTGSVKSPTVPKASTLVIETSRVTMEPPLDQTATVTSKPVTVAHTLSPNTVIRATQTDLSSASTTHTTLKESNTANAPGTNSATAVMNEQEASTTKTSAQGSSSVVYSESATVDIRETTTNTLPEDFTSVQETSKVLTMDHSLEGPTTVIRVTQADTGTASTTHTTLTSNTAQSSNTPTRAPESRTSTSTAVINEPEAIGTKTTPAEATNSVLKSTMEGTRTTTNGLVKSPTVPKVSTLVTETSRVTMEPPLDQTATVTSKPVTVAHTLSPNTVIRATQTNLSSASTTHTTLKESNTANAPGTSSATTVMNEQEASTTKTSAQGSSSVINSESTTVDIRTTTTNTLPEDLTLVAETPEFTSESSPAKTESITLVSMTPVTVAHTLDGSTTTTRVTQEPLTLADSNSASTAHSTLEESNTAKTNAPGTRTETAVINEQETSTTKMTSAQGSSSVKHYESATVDIRTMTTGQAKVATLPEATLTLVPETSQVTTESLPAKTESTTVKSNQVTVAHTLEVSTSDIRVTQEPGTQAEAGTALTTHTTLNKSNIDDSTNVSGSSTTTTFIKEPEIPATKTTLAQDSTSVINSAKAEARTTTTTTGLAKLATVPEALTLVLQTFNVTSEPSPPKTKSTTQDVDADIASTAHSTFKEGSSTAKTNAPNTANAQGTAATVINDQVTSTNQITSAEGLVSVIKSTTEVTKTTTTGSTKLATESKSSTLKPQTSGVTMEPPPAKTQSAIVTSKPVTEAQTFEGPTSGIRVTQDGASSALSAHTTMEKSNTSPNAPNTVNPPGTSTATTPINRPEASTTKTTSTQASSSVNKSSTEVTNTTGLANNTSESKGSTLVPAEPSPAKTQSTTQVSIMPITVAHTLEGPTTNANTTAPPVALPTVLKFASPTSQTLKSTGNTTPYTRATTLSPTIMSTNASRNASVPHTSPAQPHRHKPTSLKPPTSTPAMSAATELPTHQPVLNEGSIVLLFSLNETFNIVYSDRTTAEFLSLATKVVIAINKLYRGEFKEFKRSRVNSFSKGSIKVDMTLVFENTSVVPSTANVEKVLLNAVTINGTRLNIINDTIKAVPPKTDALTTIQANTANAQQTTVKTNTNTGYTNTSSASAWILHFSILAATAIINSFRHSGCCLIYLNDNEHCTSSIKRYNRRERSKP